MGSVGQTEETVDEQVRLAQLDAYAVLDTQPEQDFDDIANLAAELCQTPIALVSFVDADRQWFKARTGLQVCETPRSDSFCAHAMQQHDVMQIPDALLDPRFADNPLVLGEPHIRFYAGAPLRSATGAPLGTLCVIDREPRLLTPTQCAGLTTLARHVMVGLELRRHRQRGESEAAQGLERAEQVKDEFLARITHELRTPLTSIHAYLEALDDQDLPPGVSRKFMATIRRNSDRLLRLVDDMMLAAQLRSDAIALDKRPVDLAELAADAVRQNLALAEAQGLTLHVAAPAAVPAYADSARLAQAIDHLVLNAIKFTRGGGITISAALRDGQPTLSVTDTGVGMPDDDRERLFQAFRRSPEAEKAEVPGVGLGLTIVKSIIERHGGVVGIVSSPGHGTTVMITMPYA